jgi:cation:H+ antiporter
MFIVWLQFTIGALIIIAAGARLCFYGDIIGDKTRLSKVFIGVIFLGIVTSLPELVTSLTAGVKLDAIDLALGNVLGSNNFNLLIIVILDLLYRKGSITSRANLDRTHVVSAGWSLLLILVVILSIAINKHITVFNIANVGIDSMLIALVYIVAIKSMPKEQSGELFYPLDRQRDRKADISLTKACLGFVIAAIFVVLSGMWLANIGDKIAELTGWGETFVGSIFLAMATSFPELVVSVSALKLGSVDMAFGNIFGSNMINIFIIFIIDIFYNKATVFSAVSLNHILTASLTIFLTCIVMLGLIRKKRKIFLNLGWDTLLMLIGYLIGNYILFRLR